MPTPVSAWNADMKAALIIERRIIFGDRDFAEVVVWKAAEAGHPQEPSSRLCFVDWAVLRAVPAPTMTLAFRPWISRAFACTKSRPPVSQSAFPARMHPAPFPRTVRAMPWRASRGHLFFLGGFTHSAMSLPQFNYFWVCTGIPDTEFEGRHAEHP
jgi:hypothetical protein